MNLPLSYSNLLLRVPNWLGDSMMATPVVAAIHQTFPQTRLTVLSKPSLAPVWKSFPQIQEVLVLENGLSGYKRAIDEIRSRKFDAALCLPNSFSSAWMLWIARIPVRIGWGAEGRDFLLTKVIPGSEARQKHLVWEYLELVQKGMGQPIRMETFQLHFPLSSPTRLEAKKTLQALGINLLSGWIGLGPGATYGPAKRWPLDHWKRLIIRLLESGPENLLVIGGAQEKAYLNDLWQGLPDVLSQRLVSLVGKTNPMELAAVLEMCKLFITNDTGPMHVAAAVGTPTIALFGSTSPMWTRPLGLGHEVIYKGVECSPCYQKTCPIGYLCLNDITMEEVFQRVQQKLKSGLKIEGEKAPTGVFG